MVGSMQLWRLLHLLMLHPLVITCLQSSMGGSPVFLSGLGSYMLDVPLFFFS